uniref:Lysozyme C, milk isozyme n=1 Tax=Lygus hesperus TaxID=30085 RepID=A0A146MGL1_LYGHE
MMVVVSVLLVLSLIVASSNGEVFSPCDLAKLLKFKYGKELNEHLGGNVSLALCIAGYRHYNTSYVLKFSENTIYYGIFGLQPAPDCGDGRVSNLVNNIMVGDLECLNNSVLKDPKKLYMYDRLCATDLTRRSVCKYNQYYDIAEVWDPVYPDIIDMTFGEEHAVVKYLSAHNIDYYNPPGTAKVIAKTDTPTEATITRNPNTTTEITTFSSTASINLSSPANGPHLVQVVVTSHPQSILIITTAISIIILVLGIAVYHLSMRYIKKPTSSPNLPGFVLVPQSSITYNPNREEIMFPHQDFNFKK